jgi:Rad3-related DNA helicase
MVGIDDSGTQGLIFSPMKHVPARRDRQGEHVLAREDGAATIMTSATLATGRSFDYQRSRLGLDLVYPLPVREHPGKEMFDYEKNALVYLEAELPPPVPARQDEFLEGPSSVPRSSASYRAVGP